MVGNISLAWVRHVTKTAPHRPFFAYIAPKAAHEPFIPAPWHVDAWPAGFPEHEPRPPPWNSSALARKGKHGNIPSQPMLTAEAARVITGVFKNRWRTLMSVDDLIGEAVRTCEVLRLMERTYFIFTSDHGFQLGEDNMLMDKRHVYDWDTRVHLLARGPGIPARSTFAFPATLVDLAPTFLGLAGLPKPPAMDGRSLIPLLTAGGDAEALPPSVGRHLRAAGPREAYAGAWRREVFIEYYFVAPNDKCVENCTLPGTWPKADSWCTDLPNNAQCWGPPQCNAACYPTEDRGNNFISLRTVGGATAEAAGREGDAPAGDVLYAEFATGDQAVSDVDFGEVAFVEMYRMASDAWMTDNVALNESTAPERAALHARLRKWYACAGEQCP